MAALFPNKHKMFLKKSFRYYKIIYGVNRDHLDRNISGIIIFLYKLLLHTLSIGIDKIFLLYLKYFIKKQIYSNSIVAFVFTEYDLKIATTLNSLGLSFQIVSFGKFTNDKSGKLHLSDNMIFLASLADSKTTLLELESCINDEIVYRNKIRLIKLSGLLLLFKLLLKEKSILMNFNDHSVYDVCSHDYAKSLNLKTIYIQHAPVGYHFPALYHELNILFSNDSLEKYKRESESINTFLLFDIRFYYAINELLEIPPIESKRTILICINDFDNFTIVTKTAKLLFEKGYKVIIRPHPRDTDKYTNCNYYSISKSNSIWHDLNRVNIVLTNESGVVLEAIFTKKLLYKCAFFSKSLDNYSFLKKKLLSHESNSIEDLLSDIETDLIVYDKELLPYFIGDFENLTIKIEKLNAILELMSNINGKTNN
jgi:hypothetical protein